MVAQSGAVDFAEISFFELDRLFAASARALRRKVKRKRRERAGEGGSVSPDRSRSPQRRTLLRRSRLLQPFGGFTGSVEKVERTIVAQNVPIGVEEKVLFNYFSKCGTVNDVKILRNRYDTPTGIVVVEFGEDDAVARAVGMVAPHNELMGQTINLKRADAQLKQSNPGPRRMMTRQQFTQQVLSGLKTGTGPESGPHMRKLHIKNLRPVVTEDDMRGIFKPFGEFEKFEMGSQECWITFQSHSDAQDAMSSMQGFQLVGQELQISLQSVTVAPPAPPPPPERLNLSLDSDFGSIGGTGSLNLNNRMEVMKKLMSSHSEQGVPTVVGVAAPPPPGAPAPAAPANPAAANMPPTPKAGTPSSRTLLLQNMFTPSSVNLQKDPRFYEEIREDTHDECAKFGKVLHVTVDPRGSTGLIYVLFEVPTERIAAESSMNGRWFEGKKIIAAGIDDSIWQALAAQNQASA